MKKQFISLCIFLLPVFLFAQKEAKDIKQLTGELDQQVPKLLEDFAVPGTAIAIIKNGEVVLQKGYGYADLGKGIKVTPKTGFNIASMSKTVSAWGVMKLVQEGKIDLDAPAEKYLTRWHFPKSEFDSKGVTIRRLLSHTAGLSLHGYPGWNSHDTLPTLEESLNGKTKGAGAVKIIMEPGTKWQYSGGGYTVLQLIIEEVTKERFEDYMQKNILNALGMTNSSYTIDQKILNASSQEYDGYADPIDFELFTTKAAAGLQTNLEDFTKFAQASLYKNKQNQQQVLSIRTVQTMMESAPASNNGYGLGYATWVDSVPGTAVTLRGHDGGNAGWACTFVVDPASNDGIIILTNGGAGYAIWSKVYHNWLDWKIGKPLKNRLDPKPPLCVTLKRLIEKGSSNNIEATYYELKKNQADKYDFEENQLNQLGYYYLQKNQVNNAVAVLKINTKEFPNSYNVYDSYGEALLKSGNKEKAIENYKRSVQLNPVNENGVNVLKDLGIHINTDSLIKKVPVEHLQLLAGEYIITNPEADAGYPAKRTIVFTEENGVLWGKDLGYRYHLVPIGNDSFINPDDGASLIFDSKDKNAMTLLLFGTLKLKKVIH